MSMRWRFFFICLIVVVTCWVSRHFAGDDALIYARYIRNALRGQGMVFNPGERVNALTSPLFAMLLLAASWVLHGRILLAELLLSGIFLIAACGVAERFAPWSGVLVASTSYFYACIGMETFLFLFMLGFLALLYIDERLDWIPLIAILTILTRFEGLALVAAIAYQLFREGRRPAWWSYFPAAIVAIAYVSSNYAFYGRWLPSSTLAKIEQGFSGIWGRWPTAFLHILPLKHFFMPSLYVIPFAVVLAIAGIQSEKSGRMNRVLLPFGLALGAFYVLFNIPNYHWYYAPFIFFTAIYAMRGLPPSRVAHICLALTILECFGASIYLMRNAGAPPDYIAMGTWLQQNTRPDARIAAVEIGTLAWYDDRYTDDLLGLTNPANAQRVMRHDWTTWLPEQQPDYVVMHEHPAFGEAAAAVSSDYAYVPVHFGSIYLMKRITPRR